MVVTDDWKAIWCELNLHGVTSIAHVRADLPTKQAAVGSLGDLGVHGSAANGSKIKCDD